MTVKGRDNLKAGFVLLAALLGLASFVAVSPSGAGAQVPHPTQAPKPTARLATTPTPNLPQAALVRRVETTRPYVAITVDDFISANYAWHTGANILRSLNDLNATVTLFPTGGALAIYKEHYPDQEAELQALFAAGNFEVGDHTWSHPYLDRQGFNAQYSEIERGQQGVSTFFGVTPDKFMRPPYGHWNASTLEAAYKAGFPYVVLWSIDSRDSVGAEKPASQLVAATNCAMPGDIILFHANRQSSADAIPEVIRNVRAKGLEPVDLSTLIASGTPTRSDPAPSQRAKWCRQPAPRREQPSNVR